jgi:hypothetical protein
MDLGTLVAAGPEASGGCTTVNGSINFQELFFADTFNLAVQPANQIIQFILTFPVRGGDRRITDFDLTIRRKDNPNITDNTDVLQSCWSTRAGQEACSIVLQQTDFAAGPFLPVEITVQAKAQFATLADNSVLYTTGTGNYTLEIVSTVAPEVGNRKTICPDTGPSTILEQDTNGSNGKSVVDPNPPAPFRIDTDPRLFQDVGTLHAQGCIPIRNATIGEAIIETSFVNDVATNPAAESDGFDKYEFSVETTVPTVAFILNSTSNLADNTFNLVIDEPISPTTPGGPTVKRLAECRTVGPLDPDFPGTPVVTCTVFVPSSRNLRVGVWSSYVCFKRGCSSLVNYSLDIIAISQPTILVTPVPCPEIGDRLIRGLPGC